MSVCRNKKEIAHRALLLLLGSLVHAQTFRFRKKSLQKFIENTREHRDISEELADSWTPFLIKKGYRSIFLR